MVRRRDSHPDEAGPDAAPDGPPGFYDRDEAGDDALWFLPDPADEDVSAATDPPWRRPRRSEIVPTAADWAAAEAALAGPLARSALVLGALDERVRLSPPGLRRRLVCLEVSELSWHLGDRVTVDRLSLYLVHRLAATDEDAQSLSRAAWAVRRLERAQAPDLDAIAGFLDREATVDRPQYDLMSRPTGAEFAALVDAWRAEVAAAAGLHPLTRAALAWQGWRRHGLSGEAAMIEGAVLAARLAGGALRPGGLGFVPVALGGSAPLRPTGRVDEALAAWLHGIEAAALRGLMECDRIDRWAREAAARTGDMSGRTPARLIEALQKWPLVSAPMLETETGASRAAVQRNMTRFEDLGLVDEVTGQSRFRFWRLALTTPGSLSQAG